MPIMQPGFRYTKAQVRQLMTEEHARTLQYQGYVLQVDGQGYYTLVHHSKSFGSNPKLLSSERDGALLQADGSQFSGEGFFEKPDPVRKRTPQERLESLVKKLWPQASVVGHIPGLKDEDVLPIVLNAQEKDLHQQRITGEAVKAIASEFLTRAEKEHEEKLSHQITRHED